METFTGNGLTSHKNLTRNESEKKFISHNYSSITKVRNKFRYSNVAFTDSSTLDLKQLTTHAIMQ